MQECSTRPMRESGHESSMRRTPSGALQRGGAKTKTSPLPCSKQTRELVTPRCQRRRPMPGRFLGGRTSGAWASCCWRWRAAWVPCTRPSSTIPRWPHRGKLEDLALHQPLRATLLISVPRLDANWPLLQPFSTNRFVPLPVPSHGIDPQRGPGAIGLQESAPLRRDMLVKGRLWTTPPKH